MRVFDNLNEAIVEIKRDLAKSPTYQSSRVQNREDGRMMSEAEPYLYSVTLSSIPSSPKDLVDIGITAFPFWQQQDPKVLTQWLSAELDSRLWASEAIMAYADDRHPELNRAFEGNQPSYSYNERMIGWRELMLRDLTQPGSRRAFWPIFAHQDAVRSPLKTRIPCTIGYQWILRPVLGEQDNLLDSLLLQRSCYFQRFWLSDLWFTAELTRTLLSELQSQDFVVEGGVVSHFISSFHAFIDEEVF